MHPGLRKAFGLLLPEILFVGPLLPALFLYLLHAPPLHAHWISNSGPGFKTALFQSPSSISLSFACSRISDFFNTVAETSNSF